METHNIPIHTGTLRIDHADPLGPPDSQSTQSFFSDLTKLPARIMQKLLPGQRAQVTIMKEDGELETHTIVRSD